MDRGKTREEILEELRELEEQTGEEVFSLYQVPVEENPPKEGNTETTTGDSNEDVNIEEL